MKKYIMGLADYVYNVVNEKRGDFSNRLVRGYSEGGDAQFGIDDIAERAVIDYVGRHKMPVALFTEDGGFHIFGENPRFMLIVDPIDGTRSAAADLEMSCISIALAPFSEKVQIKDVQFALLKELKSGAVIYGDSGGIVMEGYKGRPRPSRTKMLKNMFWSIEFNGHPCKLMTAVYGDLVNYTANNGGIFIFNSASFSISRIITGQLDAYADIGNRVLKDNPEFTKEFESVGNGKVLHLFPYDIAASVILAEKAGIVITDAYGRTLDDTYLTDISMENQQSCVAASTPELHKALMDNMKWENVKHTGRETFK